MKYAAILRSLLPFLLALPLLLAGGCHKPEPDEPEAVPLPAELKSYTLFEPGTYWIYQDSASQHLDSVWVVSTERSVVRFGMKGTTYPSEKYEDFHLRTRSSQGGLDQVYSVIRYCGLPYRDDGDGKGGPCWSVQRAELLPNSTEYMGGRDIFPYRITRDKSTFIGEGYAYWHSQPLSVGRQPYADVLEVNSTYIGHSYWAPSLGIVRERVKVNYVPYTRTLVRSHIVQ